MKMDNCKRLEAEQSHKWFTRQKTKRRYKIICSLIIRILSKTMSEYKKKNSQKKEIMKFLVINQI